MLIAFLLMSSMASRSFLNMSGCCSYLVDMYCFIAAAIETALLLRNGRKRMLLPITLACLRSIFRIPYEAISSVWRTKGKLFPSPEESPTPLQFPRCPRVMSDRCRYLIRLLARQAPEPLFSRTASSSRNNAISRDHSRRRHSGKRMYRAQIERL